jgi:anti-sigma-K factor RskA
MTHTLFEESVAAYAMGALDADERRAFEAHLASCPKCAAELAELRRVTTGLAMSVERVAPPADLKARTIARATAQSQAKIVRDAPAQAPPVAIVHSEPARASLSLAWLAAAAGVAVAIGAGVYAWSLRSQLSSVQQVAAQATSQADRLRAELVSSRQESAKMAQTLGVLGAADVVRVELKGQGDLTTASAQVYWSATRGLLVLNASNLPAIDRDRVFELWAVPPGAGAAPLPAGLFRVDQAGLVTVVSPPPATFPAADAFAITVEPTAGSAQPTSAIILVGKTKKA